MKTVCFLLALIVYSSSIAFAQGAPKDFQPPKHIAKWMFGYKPEEVRRTMLAEPGFIFHSDSGPRKYVPWRDMLFFSNDSSTTYDFSFTWDYVDKIEISFTAVDPKISLALLNGCEPVGKGEWVDKVNKALIRREFSGSTVTYFIEYIH